MKILTNNDPFLKYNQKSFEGDVTTLKSVAEEMFDCMLANNGIGLAANQVGLAVNMFVMQIYGKKYTVINPKIVSFSNKSETLEEGCLSFPKLRLDVKRPISAVVEYTDTDGNTINEELKGLAARCFLHEEQHLRGIVFTSRVSKRDLLKAKMKLR